jgi:molybdopterin-guanine dinucleotide biosynthesis protein A
VSRLSFTGIVLAGGRSSRMGCDKAALERGGRTLLDATIALLTQAGASRVLVSGERPAHAGIPDDLAARGPVGGLGSVLAHCGDGAVAVLPVDMPLLQVDAIHALVGALASARACCFERHPLPCALIVDAAARATLAEVLAAEPAGPSVRAALRALGAVELPIHDAGGLASVNTPADWDALHA